jgi:uncharacterized protein YggU (UPF0235/DUF167 family)
MTLSHGMNVKVRVRANARRETLETRTKTSFIVSVREKAEGNAANHRVVELIAEHFGVPHKAVRVVRGHHAPSKTLSIHGVD